MSIEIAENPDLFQIVKETADLDRARADSKLAVIIGLEGLSGIGKNLDLLYLFQRFGVRHASLTWNEENALATGVKGNRERGLTETGVRAVRLMEELGMIVDVSHLNEKSFWDVYEVSSRPFIASHSNCHALCPVPRNITDEQIKAIADSGGVIGVNACKGFIHSQSNKRDAWHLADHIDHIVELVGIDHVGFGFDFCDYLRDTANLNSSGDGIAAKGIEDASKAQNMIEILQERGYTPEEIEKVSYKNFYRVIKEILG